MTSNIDSSPSIGWREWIALPDLSISQIKVKIDTGARSSALHAFDIQQQTRQGDPWVEFKIHPLQHSQAGAILAAAKLVDERYVTNSGGQTQLRPVIMTDVVLGDYRWPIELTLTNRDVMGFRMLLGRQAVRHRFLIDPGRSYLLSHQPSKK
ncbi:MAG: ATP-dependent zinc protease [Leptolyngbya sp. SIO4C1]|nr:ATP-dependent zinc protease [Leptolyngbya sp. SIO4C1]